MEDSGSFYGSETNHPMDLLALNHVIATAIAAWA